MRQKIDPRVPRYSKLIMPTFVALKELGGSGNNDEILNRVIANLKLPDEVVDIPHLGASNISELQYQLAWSRTYLKLTYGKISKKMRPMEAFSAPA